MTKPLFLLAAAALAAAAAPAYAAAGPVACVNTGVYQVQHNPVRPLPSGGGGGGEPTMVIPGDPVGYVKYDVTALTTAAKCAAS
ncbi:MAG TPA: hypothetical protein VF519_16010 [Mycobacteriales bacterium]|jgi:hypothetical protein